MIGALAVAGAVVSGLLTAPADQRIQDIDTLLLRPKPVSFVQPFAHGAIRIYQRFVSPLRAGSCPMVPHCSEYAYQAFARYPAWLAFVMTADRLHRCSHDLGNYTRNPEALSTFLDPVPGPWPRAASPEAATEPRFTVPPQQEAVRGDTPGAWQEERLFRFAGELQSAGRFAEAALEYERFLSYFPGSDLRTQAMGALHDTLRRGGQLLEAVRAGRGLLAAVPAGSDADRLRLVVGMDLLRLENVPQARQSFDEVIVGRRRGPCGEAVLLRGYTYAQERRWEESAAAYRQAGCDLSGDQKVRAEASAELAVKGKRLPRRSPAIAGLLSLIPGLGYLYSGYPQTGIASAVVNGLFIGGTYKAFASKNKPLGSVLALFSLGWYGGNIYGSIGTTRRWNAAVEAKHLAAMAQAAGVQ